MRLSTGAANSLCGIHLKWIALLALVGQTVAVVVLLRLSRIHDPPNGKRYLNTTAVVSAEVVKFIASLLIIASEKKFDVRATAKTLDAEILRNPSEMLRISLPAILYTIQNNLLFVSLSNLPGAVYQVTYQLKILTTAMLSVLLLQKHLPCIKWVALVLLTAGVAVIQIPTTGDGKHETSEGNTIIGLAAVLCACFTSGLAGVYLEKLLKESTTTVWIRNLQLAVYGFVVGTIGAFWKDGAVIRDDGFFGGYDGLVITVILLQALGGIVVAVVLKYADNVLKCFGNALSIVFSSILSWVLIGDFSPSMQFCFGTVGVIFATYLYIVDKPIDHMRMLLTHRSGVVYGPVLDTDGGQCAPHEGSDSSPSAVNGEIAMTQRTL